MSEEGDGSGSSLNGADQVMVNVVHIACDQLDNDLMGSGEPAIKRHRSDSGGGELMQSIESITIDWGQDNVKQIMFNLNRVWTMRLDAMENKLEMLHNKFRIVEAKVTHLVDKASKQESEDGRRLSTQTFTRHGQAIVVGLTQTKQRTVSESDDKAASNSAFGSNVTLITLNSEDDYPSGVWLGDENNPETRVRVPITPSDLLHIHSNCRTAEKMALTLLDYLFDRDTQASSNLSGTGKHGKKQLDPLLIYGIRCHLIHRFGVTEADWHRIKLNIDSKCRTAFRRKVRGQSLAVKAFRSKLPPDYLNQSGSISSGNVSSESNDDDSSLHPDDDMRLHLQETATALGLDSQTHVSGAHHSGGGGELQIIHATEEQLAQLQQTHQLQILQGNQVPTEILQHLQQQVSNGGGDMRVAMTSLGQSRGLHVIHTQSGETALAVSDAMDNGNTIQVINENGELLHIHRSQVSTEDDGTSAVLANDDDQS